MTFNEANKENVEKSRLIHEGLLDPTDYEKKYTLLRKYLTRGGFIKDKNGRWCKVGDRVLMIYKQRNVEGVLVFKPFGNIPDWKVRYISKTANTEQYTSCVTTKTLVLLEPCEPDICKDFEEENI